MKTLYQTERLEATASTGRKKYWLARVIQDDDLNVYTQSESWQETAKGLSQPVISTPKLIKAKNVGKANETTQYDQAVSEVTSNYNRKRDKGYHLEGEEVESHPLPMLAHSYEKRGHNISWPCYVQPKLDGVRMVFDGTTGWSRMGKEFIPEVIQHLQCELPEGIVLDGELMLDHDSFTFQETMRAIKKFRPDVSPLLQYHVYDIVGEGSFDDRWNTLVGAINGLTTAPNIKLVHTAIADDEPHFKEWHADFVADGYEGIMLRNGVGDYTIGQRSANLQKFKHFLDAEFEITDVIDGEAKEEGCAIFICKTQSGDEFKARPRGTVEERRELFAMREQLIGQPLTVRFQEYSDDGIPRFPVGIVVREAWDLSPVPG